MLTSPLQRARKTCDLVDLRPSGESDADLAEWDYGDYEGLRSVDIRRHRPDWDLYRDGCPHGESPAQVLERTDRLISRLRKREGTIALFSHGKFGGVLAARWIKMPLAAARHFTLSTASHSILGSDPHHPEVRVIELWNEVSCLSKITHLKPGAIDRWENEGGEIPNEKPVIAAQ